MKQTRKKLLALGTGAALALSMSCAALAAETALPTPDSEEAAAIAAEAPDLFAAKSKYLNTLTPKPNSVYYIGEKMPVKVKINGPAGLSKVTTSFYLQPIEEDTGLIFDECTKANTTYRYQFDTSSYIPGTYLLVGSLVASSGSDISEEEQEAAARAALEEMGLTEDDLEDMSDEEMAEYFALYLEKLGIKQDKASAKVTLRKLKAPAKVWAKAGSGKVTVTWKKAPGAVGACRYQVYRSAKKSTGFKRIATVKGKKYVDKSAKRGQKYYYRLRTVRTKYGTVRSGWSKAARSGKVK